MGVIWRKISIFKVFQHTVPESGSSGMYVGKRLDQGGKSATSIGKSATSTEIEIKIR